MTCDAQRPVRLRLSRAEYAESRITILEAQVAQFVEAGKMAEDSAPWSFTSNRESKAMLISRDSFDALMAALRNAEGK